MKAPGIHHFPSRAVKCLLRCSPLFLYGVFCRPLSCTTSLPECCDVCSVTHPCSSRNFLKAPGIHHFPSRVWLDAAVRRCCLFPVRFRHSATSIETHLRFRQRCLLRSVSSLTYGNIQRLEQLHLRSDE